MPRVGPQIALILQTIATGSRFDFSRDTKSPAWHFREDGQRGRLLLRRILRKICFWSTARRRLWSCLLFLRLSRCSRPLFCNTLTFRWQLAGRMPFTRVKGERDSCNQYQILLHQVSQFEHTKVTKERFTEGSRFLFFPRTMNETSQSSLIKIGGQGCSRTFPGFAQF